MSHPKTNSDFWMVMGSKDQEAKEKRKNRSKKTKAVLVDITEIELDRF
jgi:hypothetical protein